MKRSQTNANRDFKVSKVNEWLALSPKDAEKYFVEGRCAEIAGRKEKQYRSGKTNSNKKRPKKRDEEEIVIEDMIWTRPKTLLSKKANYFQLNAQTDWCLYQYRVDFSPEEERTIVKRQMIQTFHEKLGEGYIFDGTVLFTRNRLQEVGRNYFDPTAAVTTLSEYKMQLWPGYVTSVRQHEDYVLMCAEITHKVMRRDTVLDQLTDCLIRFPNDFQRVFKRTILGSIVLTDYNNKTYRVDDVDFSLTPESGFKLNERTTVSYMDYYSSRYDIKIKHKNQPLLLTMPKQKDRRRGIKQPIYLIPELCRMTGLNEQMSIIYHDLVYKFRKNFPLMKALAERTRLGPAERIDRLYQYAKRLQSDEKTRKDLDKWNMKFSSRLVTFQARVLGPERIIQRGTGQETIYLPSSGADWTKELRRHSMLVIGNMKDWVLVSPAVLMREAKTFVEEIQRAGRGMGFNLHYPKELQLEDDHLMTYTSSIEKLCKTGRKPSLILVVIPNQRLDSLTGPSIMSIATKVAVQINCKIGGAPWTIDIPLEGLMVVGFDVYHDTSQRGRSIGAIVASLNKPLTRYYSSVSYHRSGEELSNELSINIIKALHKYKAYNQGSLPKKIVIYRDGVGEGQVTYVVQHEVELLKQQMAKIYEGRQYNMVFIIVTKRINTRLFDNGRNPPPGTVVDDVITLPHRYDFFLVSQSVKQGTVSPTSYNVVHDNGGLTPDRLQRLTYKLTHLYFNWSGTVRVPAPCQYAHKLAYLVGQAINKCPNSEMDDILYFL
ncbi:hypothetical protein J437_LFUL003188 [Ladona fulva]|uniref:Piwi n=1 Tax=Ladona fulva TaxID=123851 RepID=A0A8K0NTV7_LADFU|nr:hypothetical protein J437_LFUL003188 [Ladona fulva]